MANMPSTRPFVFTVVIVVCIEWLFFIRGSADFYC
jgi:hypothetical protein